MPIRSPGAGCHCRIVSSWMMRGGGPTIASPTPRRNDQGSEGPRRCPAHSPELSRCARPRNRYLRHEAELGGRVRELAIPTTARELDSQFEWAAHEPEAISEGVSQRSSTSSSIAGSERSGRSRRDCHRAGPRDLRGGGRWRRRLSLGRYGSLAAARWSISSPSWAIMPGQQRFSRPSTCNSIQVSHHPWRPYENPRDKHSTPKPLIKIRRMIPKQRAPLSVAPASSPRRCPPGCAPAVDLTRRAVLEVSLAFAVSLSYRA
jgi:hypothetical protein